ncbi:hypothetical protein LWF01_05525 [Saxibacter everestensis]|uniref:Uncharacterized protein n=1 Tax=Saxibacter everestensis TaxID=2909229 RepID=A0ABY8QW87_9MICO|nr:hypothetical protein LWF01_05525 [Brevibacteriaceae bacterium ZFBP1038]
MAEVSRASTSETLEYLHGELDVHFSALYKRRQLLDPPAPVFALEHRLTDNDLELLQEAVRSAHREGLHARASGHSWLPFVVHAAEVGYIYDGGEYWPIYAKATQGWVDSEYERDRIRTWFRKFAREYGGAIPQGAWANTFRKIAWPITHAVLPRYLQVQLAKMLSDYRTGWPEFLDDPHELGVRLHSWSRRYSDRLEKFCQNTALVGHVAVALLLSGEDEDSPYIASTTLARLVESLNSERQSRRWLHDARRSASTVRTHNFRPAARAGRQGDRQQKRLPAATDPKLQVKREGGVWKAYAVLPDLKSLQHTLPIVYDELRKYRAVVAGARQVIPTGGLLFATAPVEFSSWPAPTEPFLRLQRASQEVNLLIADQCRITSGPWWVFRRAPGEPGVEVKGKFVRPGVRYCIVGATELAPPDVAWCQAADVAVEGVSAYDLAVPTVLSEIDAKALVLAGLSVVSDVSIRPVGVVASSWDGEGAVEWLAGEPALIAVHAQHSPPKARLSINGEPHYVEWPTHETEVFLILDGLEVGTHEIVVSIGDPDGDGRKAEGSLVATIRDPQVHDEGSTAGEGLRLRTLPAQPSLPELWDGHAVVELDGPDGTIADLRITLCDGYGIELSSFQRSLRLPITGNDWRRLFSQLRHVPDLAKHYDEADVAHLAVSRAGIGFATVSCERGFRGLRWVLSARHREGDYVARLIDRTDANSVSIKFFSVERPLTAEERPSDQVFVAPPRGGLLWATNGEQVVGQIVPPEPNQLLRLGVVRPSIPTAQKSLAEVSTLIQHHRMWKDAELPAHPFGAHERQLVLDAITTATAVMLAPGQWATFEHRVVGLAVDDIDLNRAQTLVGDSPSQRKAAHAIADNLWRWSTPEVLIQGFGGAVSGLMEAAGITNTMKGSRLLLQLASSPGDLLDWDETERNRYLRCVLTDPVLIRAARFAVLGTIEEITGGVG